MMRNYKRLLRHIFAVTALATVVFSSVPLTSYASENNNEEGLKIATESRERQKGYGNFAASLTMILRNKRGQESKREVRIKVIEVEGEGDRTLFIFDNPRDVKGTGFLVHAHKHKQDDQWLYLPALKRVKRISSSNQSGSFMGSEFSYEDLGAVEVEKFTHTHLRDEPCGDLQCAVVERVPVSEDSGYSKHLVWTDRQEYLNHKVEFYDRRGAHLKTMTVEGYQKYLDQHWRASTTLMVNHLTGKSTDMIWTDYQFQIGLDEGDFTKTALRRAR